MRPPAGLLSQHETAGAMSAFWEWRRGETFVMRPNGFFVLATLALVAPAMMTDAAAQVRRGGGPAAAPAAAPRISAPAAAPRMSAPAPHFSAPAARFAAPRV